MHDRRQQLLDHIGRAFAGVELGDGVSLHETQVIDAYGSDDECEAARAPDEKVDWRKLVADPDFPRICGSYGGMSFFDAAGLRFHLPACLSLAVTDPEGTNIDVNDILGSLEFHLTDLSEYTLERLAILDPAQRACVREVLVYLRDAGGIDGDQVDEAIAGYWSR